MPTTPSHPGRRRSVDEDTRSSATRRRLLDVALDVFCEHGFRSATVREICTKAGANVAAVNYHFKDKVGLYRAVIGEAKCQAEQTHPTSPAADVTDPAQRLEFFVRAFVERLLTSDGCATHGKLMAWEMVEPTGVLDEVVRDTIRPTWDQLRAIVADNLGVALQDSRREGLLRRATASVLGQVLLYRNCREVVERLHPSVLSNRAEASRIADHIVEFSLAALHGMKKRLDSGDRSDAPRTVAETMTPAQSKGSLPRASDSSQPRPRNQSTRPRNPTKTDRLT